MPDFTVIKCDAFGREKLSYRGTLVERTEDYVCIDASFALADRDLGYVQLRRGDRFREWFFLKRYYNIFRIAAADSGALKGWYCNITRPPTVSAGRVSAEDLELDVFVHPDGRMRILDEEDFAQLRLPAREASAARAALAEIQDMVLKRIQPFDEIETKKSRHLPAPESRDT